MDICQREMEETKPFLEKNLLALNEKITIQMSTLNPAQPRKGAKWEYFWLAPRDVTHVWHTVTEWTTRRHERVAKGRAAKFGSKAFKVLDNDLLKDIPKLNELKQLPNEFAKEAEQTDHHEWSHFKEMYAQYEMWHVESIAHETSNPDELRGCMELLAENGRLRFDKPELWMQFNRFQKMVDIPLTTEYNLANYIQLEKRLRTAMYAMWGDMDYYTTMKNKNSSSYDSKKSSFEKDCDAWAEQEGGLHQILEDALKEYKHPKKGEHGAKVDPILYEGVIDFAITKGKLDPEEKLYFLIQGMACGLLSMDRGSAIDGKHLNLYPPLEYFASATKRGKKPTREDLQEIAELDYTTFLEWYHSECMTLPKVTQRIDKTITQGNALDHDDIVGYAGHMSEASVEALFKRYGTGYKLPLTGAQNITVAMLFYLDNFAENSDAQSPQDLQRFIGSFVRFDGILGRKMYVDDKDLFRMDDDTSLNANARYYQAYKGMYGRGGKGQPQSCREHLYQVQQYLRDLDPEFFDPLFNGSLKKDDKAKVESIVRRMKASYGEEVFGVLSDGKTAVNEPKTPDELYQTAGTVAGNIIKKRPERLQKLIARIKQDHQRHFAGVKSAGEKTYEQVRREAQDKVHAFRRHKMEESDKMDTYVPGQHHGHANIPEAPQSDGGAGGGDDSSSSGWNFNFGGLGGSSSGSTH